jgi:hypothetical protein
MSFFPNVFAGANEVLVMVYNDFTLSRRITLSGSGCYLSCATVTPVSPSPYRPGRKLSTCGSFFR